MLHPEKALAGAITSAAEQFVLPESVLLAWSWQATEWTVSSYAYEPNVDRLDVAGKPGTWSPHPDWVVEGPTAEEFFLLNPDREADCLPDANYEFVAQTAIAAGYGPFLLRYPAALKCGFTGDPEELRSTDEGVHWAARVLQAGIDEGASVGRRGDEALAFGLMTVGGRVPSRSRVLAVEAAHRTLFGRGYFRE